MWKTCQSRPHKAKLAAEDANIKWNTHSGTSLLQRSDTVDVHRPGCCFRIRLHSAQCVLMSNQRAWRRRHEQSQKGNRMLWDTFLNISYLKNWKTALVVLTFAQSKIGCEIFFCCFLFRHISQLHQTAGEKGEDARGWKQAVTAAVMVTALITLHRTNHISVLDLFWLQACAVGFGKCSHRIALFELCMGF